MSICCDFCHKKFNNDQVGDRTRFILPHSSGDYFLPKWYCRDCIKLDEVRDIIFGNPEQTIEKKNEKKIEKKIEKKKSKKK